jgi:hypothetical protein
LTRSLSAARIVLSVAIFSSIAAIRASASARAAARRLRRADRAQPLQIAGRVTPRPCRARRFRQQPAALVKTDRLDRYTACLGQITDFHFDLLKPYYSTGLVYGSSDNVQGTNRDE